ncbi:MAG: sensor histidine kinase [Flavobacteriales bacterium]|nr:sensor histidine kinase [Flavobacteriales bacterium]
MGRFETALEYSNLYHNLKDSLENELVNARVADLQAQYESNQRENELEETKQQLSDAGVQHRSDTIALWVSVISGLFVLVIAGLFYGNLRKSKFRNLKLRLQSEHIQEKNKIIDAQLKDKDVLLKEIHHRVKNNLQMISSLLNLQAQKVRSKSAKSALQESKDRVQAIAMIHKGLYKKDQFAEVDIQEYIENLISYHQDLQEGVKGEVDFETDIESIVINLDTAVPLGLIVSELLSNSSKHAFSDSFENGEIRVEIKPLDGLKIRLVYSDNGVGMPENVAPSDINSIGMEIVESLVEQLDGQLRRKVNNGTQFTIDFLQQKV